MFVNDLPIKVRMMDLPQNIVVWLGKPMLIPMLKQAWKIQWQAQAGMAANGSSLIHPQLELS